MYSNVRGKLVESKVITIAPKGLKEYIVNKLDSGLEINETQIWKLRARTFEKQRLSMVKFLRMRIFLPLQDSLSFNYGRNTTSYQI
ncbi:MAG TPA: hypothetical protein PK733_09940 [Clostridiales bacterium]|nr:hypothetical protein [Clostridiales bacterium]